MQSWTCARCGAVVTSGGLVCPDCGAVADHAGSATLMVTRPKPGFSSEALAPAPVTSAPASVEETPSGSMAAWKQGRQGSMVPGDVFANRFRIERLLGSGSLTTAFVARASGVQGFVCLKIMHPRKAVDAGTVREWISLQQAVSRYQAPGIARVYEAGVHGDMPWCAMEYVPGPTLRMWMLEKLQFDTRVPAGLDIVQNLVRIFERVHELGCYGVLKPENVVITRKGPVILDFGIPGFLTTQEFEFNAYARRYLPYMAPELRQDFANLIPQSDYYSIGALLYEILTGRPPASPVKLPSELSPIFSVEADEVVLKSLSPNPADRFGSNIGFFGALNALRDALRQKRPTSFAAPLGETLADADDAIDRNLDGTLSGAPEGHAAAVHAPNLVADPDQDFEPHGSSGRAMAMHDLEEPVHESANPVMPPPPNPFAARLSTPAENAPAEAAPAILPPLNLDASAEKTMAVASPWAALEARMTDEVVVGENVAGPEPVARQEGEVKTFDEAWLAAPPTPTWVWVLIVLLALILTAVAGYFGYHFGH